MPTLIKWRRLIINYYIKVIVLFEGSILRYTIHNNNNNNIASAIV